MKIGPTVRLHASSTHQHASMPVHEHPSIHPTTQLCAASHIQSQRFFNARVTRLPVAVLVHPYHIHPTTRYYPRCCIPSASVTQKEHMAQYVQIYNTSQVQWLLYLVLSGTGTHSNELPSVRETCHSNPGVLSASLRRRG